MSRPAVVASLVIAAALIAAPGSSADPIPDATYKGKVRGDGDRIEFNTSFDGKQIGSLTIQFDSRCVQSGNHYTNGNTSVVFYELKVRGSGKFKGKEKNEHPNGRDKQVVKGRFSADGTTARGRFTNEGTFQASGVPRVECSAKGRFKAKTNAKPPGGDGGGGSPVLGLWEGTTGEGLPVKFNINRRGLQELAFIAEVDCVREDGSIYTDERAALLPRADLNGSSFEATRSPEHIRGTFDGRTATGVVSVSSYLDEFESATCAGRGEIPFTARPSG